MIGRAVALTLALAAAPVSAALTERDLAGAVARPPTGARLPMALRFTTLDGRRASLGEAAGGRPLVLVFADYTCRHVCAPGLMLTAAALRRSGLVPGDDYRLVVVGLDPRDGPDAARAMTGRLGSIGPARAATVLLGDVRSTPAAARALGYGYVLDAEHDQFAHDAAVYVFGSDGRLRTMLPELAATPAGLRAALTDARPSAGLAERIGHLCYGFAAAHGRYGRAVVLGIQALAVLTVAALALVLLRRRRAA